MDKSAIITGVTGQDGSYLADLLLAKGYIVHGVVRYSSTKSTERVAHILGNPLLGGSRFFLHYGDLSSGDQWNNLISELQPDEIYHLGAQSQVRVSFDVPEHNGNVTGLGTTRILEAIRASRVQPRFYQASSSEMFGETPPPQNETSPFHPRNPYGAAKLYAFWMNTIYRQAYNMFNCSGILFNHESPRRSEDFVTRKITKSLANIMAGKQETLYLGNLDAIRDWGYAPDYVEAMWLMLQQDFPDDYAIGTGESHSVREFVQEAFSYVELDWQRFVKVDPSLVRPLEVQELRGDASKSSRVLGWRPRVTFQALVRIMVDADMEGLDLIPPGKGKEFLQQNHGDWHQQFHAVH